MLQVVSDFIDFDDEFGTLRAMVEASRRPLSISVAQRRAARSRYRRILDAISESNADGLEMRGAGRGAARSASSSACRAR